MGLARNELRVIKSREVKPIWRTKPLIKIPPLWFFINTVISLRLSDKNKKPAEAVF